MLSGGPATEECLRERLDLGRVRRVSAQRSPGRTKFFVIVLTILMPGLGHVLVGQILRGAVWIAGSIVIASIAVSRGVKVGDPRLLLITLPLTVIAVVDAMMHIRARDVPR